MLKFSVFLFAVTGCALVVSPTLAGSGNVLYLTQETDPGPITGNSFYSDQYAADGSSIGTATGAVLQRGQGNTASVVIRSHCPIVALTCGTAQLVQDNSIDGTAPALLSVGLNPSGALGPNTASISIPGNGDASVVQTGGDNQATMSVDDGLGVINQVGVGNSATLSLAGISDSTITQAGHANSAELSVTTLGNADVSLTQIGNNRQYDATIATTGSVSVIQFGL